MTEKQTDTRDVVLEIVGTQRLNGDSDKIELTTVGTLQTEPETLVFRYTEQQEPPEEPIYVQVRLRRGSNGGGDSAYRRLWLLFDHCQRAAEFVPLRHALRRCAHGHLRQGGGDSGECRRRPVQLRYEIDINGTLASKNQLKIDYRITGSQGE